MKPAIELLSQRPSGRGRFPVVAGIRVAAITVYIRSPETDSLSSGTPRDRLGRS